MYVYFYLFTRAGLSGQDGAAIEAAQSLGASRTQILFRVTLPRLRPALAGATLLTFMTSLGSFSAPYIFGGGFRVMTTQIVTASTCTRRMGPCLMLAMMSVLIGISLAMPDLPSRTPSPETKQARQSLRGKPNTCWVTWLNPNAS